MAINNSYVRPQSEVHQLLSLAISQTNGHGGACVVGSQYDVFRYDNGNAPAADFKGKDTTFTLPSYLTEEEDLVDYTIDDDDAQVFVKDVFAKLTTTAVSVKPDGDSLVILKAPTTTVEGSTGPVQQYWAAQSDQTVPLVIDGYSVSVTDIVKTDSITDSITAEVVELIPSEENPKAYDRIKVTKNLFDLSQDTLTASVFVGKSHSGTLKCKVSITDSTVSISDIQQVKPEGTNISATLTNSGKAYLEFRARVSYATDAEDGILMLDSVEDIQNNLGTIDPGNELAYAAWRALASSNGKTVYAVRVTDDTKDAFLTAMQKTESNTNAYAFVPLTDNKDCIDAVVDFNESMSTPEVQKWRMTFVGADLDTTTEDSVDNKGQTLNGTFYKNNSKYYFQISKSNINNGFSFSDYVVGDTIKLSNDTFEIKAISAEDTVLLSSGKDTKQTADITIKRTDSPQGNKAYVTSLASSLNSRRAVVVWCDRGRADGQTIPSAYIAAEIAGLTSAVEPQQGITRIEIKTIDQAPRMYTRYSQSTLDNIAAHGVLIVTQDSADSTPYIRHQLTTSPDKGILYSEISCTRNLDNISYAVSDLINTHIGRTNVTPSALLMLDIQLRALWDSFTTNSTSALIGPSLVNYYDVSIVQDPVALDRIVVNVTYEIPSPLNRISVYQMAYVARVNININQ